MRRSPRSNGLIAIAASILVVASAGLVLRPTKATAGDTADSNSAASALLTRIGGADRTPYHSRQIVAYFGDPQSNALLDVRSSLNGRYVRSESGDDVTRLWSHADTTEKTSILQGAASSEIGVEPQAVLKKYRVQIGKPEQVLGTALIPVSFARRSDGAVIERWLVHEKSGVVYQRSLYDARGRLVGMSTIVEMHWGDPGPDEPTSSDLGHAQRVREAVAPDAPQTLADGYELWRAYDLQVEGLQAEQWVYSDGLHALSIFRTPGHLRSPHGFVPSSVAGTTIYTGPGPGTWAWEGGGRSFLVVAEEPAIDPGELIEPLPRGGPTVWARLGSVWSRLFGLLD